MEHPIARKYGIKTLKIEKRVYVSAVGAITSFRLT